MKIIFMMIGFVIILSAQASELAQKAYKIVAPKVVYIESKFGTGTGFFINPFAIATNRHVVFGPDNLEKKWNAPQKIYTSDGKIISKYDFMICSMNVDVCLICFKQKMDAGHAVLSNEVVPGKDLFVIGHPQGLREPIISAGIISSRLSQIPTRDAMGKETSYTGFSTNAAISPGSSGSPVISAKGDILGMIVSFLKDSQNLNFAISSSELVKLFSEIPDPSRGSLAIPFGYDLLMEEKERSQAKPKVEVSTIPNKSQKPYPTSYKTNFAYRDPCHDAPSGMSCSEYLRNKRNAINRDRMSHYCKTHECDPYLLELYK